MTPESTPAAWIRWTLPSFTDLFFLVLIGILVFSPMSAGLLGDADTGWHIRSGELIMRTHAIPRTDPFSYTRHGEPWYAWEWMYDVIIAAIHHVSGLNGVVLFTAAVIGATFALLFRFILRRSGNLAVAALLTLLAMAAAQVHMLARPHVLSWLLTLLWVENLCRFEDGRALGAALASGADVAVDKPSRGVRFGAGAAWDLCPGGHLESFHRSKPRGSGKDSPTGHYLLRLRVDHAVYALWLPAACSCVSILV